MESLQGETGNRIKIYLVVGLALVLAALLYRHTQKKPVRSKSLPPATVVSAVPELPSLDVEGLPNAQLAKSVDKKSRRVFVRDIFAPLVSLPKAKRQPKKPKPQPSQRVTSLKLRGVIVGGRNPTAIINDKFVRLGERIDGYTVLRIEKKEVVLKSGNRTINLKLASDE